MPRLTEEERKILSSAMSTIFKIVDQTDPERDEELRLQAEPIGLLLENLLANTETDWSDQEGPPV